MNECGTRTILNSYLMGVGRNRLEKNLIAEQRDGYRP